jgi:uncharacterized protein involved in oxidation of intracellular sulfur
MKYLFILNDSPYDTELCYNGFRTAHSVTKDNPKAEVTVFLMADAVVCAKAGQKMPKGYYNVEQMLRRVLSGKGQILLCGTCVDSRGLTDAEMIAGARCSTMEELAATTIGCDKVPVF